MNVWQVSTSEFERRLAMDVRVESVRVTRAFPFYIDVEITERRPVAVVQEIFGYALLDKEGVVLQTAVSLRDVSLPAVTGVKSGSLLLGDKTVDKEMLSALSFLGALSENASRDFSEINIGNPANVIAYTREGVPVWLGVGDRMPERAALAERMLKDMKTRKLAVEHIDASLTSPYFKMKA